jgi:hypothetical protein
MPITTSPMTASTLLTYFPFLAILGVMATFWTQSKNLLLKIFHIFWKERQLPYDFALEFYFSLLKKSKVINFDDYNLTSASLFSLSDKVYVPVLFKQYKIEMFLYRNFVPIFICGHINGGIKVRYLKFTFNFDKFLHKVTQQVHNKYTTASKQKSLSEDRFYIGEFYGKSRKQINQSSQESLKGSSSGDSKRDEAENNNYTLSNFEALKNNLNRQISENYSKESFSWESPSRLPKNKYQFTKQGYYLLSQVEKWLKSESWYQERNIIFRRGCLLYGQPGTGKSSLILEVAKRIKIPIYIFHLGSFEDEELGKTLDDLSSYPAIILFEDVDAIWNGRKNLQASEQYGGLTFDYFINKLSGVKGIKNKFIFLTSNHIENLDPALLRDGRVDEKIELVSLNKDEKTEVAKVILSECPNFIEQVIQDGLEDTTSEFENRCVKIALGCLWNR